MSDRDLALEIAARAVARGDWVLARAMFCTVEALRALSVGITVAL